MRPVRLWPKFTCLSLLALLNVECFPAPSCAAEAKEAKAPSAKWENEIRAFEAADRTNPPPAQAILFIGSSSIRIWKSLAADFKGLSVINRGFGGSQMEDSVYFADRIVLPYRPRHIVVYAGDNDLALGKSPEQVLAAFQAFVRKVHGSLPATRIDFISVKPSPSRWMLESKIRETNRLVAEDTRTDPRLGFIDVFTPMLASDGKPRSELFQRDELHMNRSGYVLWTSLIRPYLDP
jgi:lysophospholipase L1-like esterase